MTAKRGETKGETGKTLHELAWEEINRQLDGCQADLTAALLKKPFPQAGETLDLTPPDDSFFDEQDQAGTLIGGTRMLVAFIAQDRPQGLALRMETRPAHVAFLERLNAEGKLALAGPFLDREGKPDGSLVVVKAESLDDAKAMLADDPYAQAGLFEFTDFRAWTWTFNKPEGLVP